MNVRFLTQPEAIHAEFARLLPLFKRVPIVAEYTHEQLEAMALNGKLHLGFLEVDTHIKMVMAFEFISYPNLLSVNIVALAGEGLKSVAAHFFEQFCLWCREAGVSAIEALCGDAMMRMLRQYGFGKTYNLMRYNLGVG